MDSMLICPKCGERMEPSLALKHQLEELIRTELLEKHKKDLETAKEESSKGLADELKLLREDLARKNEELFKARKTELDIRKQKNELEEEKQAFELEKQRQLDAERKKIIEKTTEQLHEQQRLKDREKDLFIETLKSSLEDAQRKANQGSQQLQGEVQELDLQEILSKAFGTDVVEPIGKGVTGADLRQRVKSPRGIDCGSILWESKRTKSWKDEWVVKLKEDVRRDGAHLPVIVTDVLPKEIRQGLGLREGVWIVGFVPELIITLGELLRKILLDSTKQKLISESKQTKAEEVYEYITSHEFSQQVESMLGTYLEMKEGISKERISFEKIWKQREAQVNKLLEGVSGMYGSIQGLAGSALPGIKVLQLETDPEDAVDQPRLIS